VGVDLKKKLNIIDVQNHNAHKAYISVKIRKGMHNYNDTIMYFAAQSTPLGPTQIYLPVSTNEFFLSDGISETATTPNQTTQRRHFVTTVGSTQGYN
jgi:hypothetical protein